MNNFFSPLKSFGIIGFILILISTVSVSAQKLKLGIRGGVSFTNFINHNASGQPNSVVDPNYSTSLFKDLKVGQTYTFYGDYIIHKNWNLEIGLGYSQKGIDLNYNSTSRSETTSTTTVSKESVVKNFRIHYITLPTVFKLKLGAKKYFYVIGGTYTAILVKADVKENVNKKNVITYDAQNNFVSEAKSENSFTEGYSHRMDFGITAGAGFETPVNEKWSIGFDVRVNTGVVNLPLDYSKYNFFNFSATTKNINMESAIKLAYSLR